MATICMPSSCRYGTENKDLAALFTLSHKDFLAATTPPPPAGRWSLDVRRLRPGSSSRFHAAASQHRPRAPRTKMPSSQSHRPGVPAPIQQEDDRLAKLKQSINEMRKDLMLVAAVWTCVAHRSALHHPGGYWKHGKEGPGGHAAGDPVMPSYETYRMLNTMAFMTSMLLVVMVSC
ncbi:hypothetical protein ZWY2020_001895 [Hordeum vulgare]|nr:hypothetical protein ZWY2020_001895 [Hordeum vulgare]